MALFCMAPTCFAMSLQVKGVATLRLRPSTRWTEGILATLTETDLGEVRGCCRSGILPSDDNVNLPVTAVRNHPLWLLTGGVREWLEKRGVCVVCVECLTTAHCSCAAGGVGRHHRADCSPRPVGAELPSCPGQRPARHGEADDRSSPARAGAGVVMGVAWLLNRYQCMHVIAGFHQSQKVSFATTQNTCDMGMLLCSSQ